MSADTVYLSPAPLYHAAPLAFSAGVQAVSDAVDFIVASSAKDPYATFAGAVPFLRLMGIVAGGWQMARHAIAGMGAVGLGLVATWAIIRGFSA